MTRRMEMATRAFTRRGAVLSPDDFFESKQSYEEKKIVAEMRRQGYVPDLDTVPEARCSPIEGKGTFEYEVKMYGIHVGEKAWRFEGILKDTGLIRRTRSSR